VFIIAFHLASVLGVKMTDHFKEWENRTFRSKALDLLGYGLVCVPVLYGLKYAASSVGLTEDQTLVDIIKDADTYAIAVGLSIGRGIYYEAGYRIVNWRAQRRS